MNLEGEGSKTRRMQIIFGLIRPKFNIAALQRCACRWNEAEKSTMETRDTQMSQSWLMQRVTVNWAKCIDRLGFLRSVLSISLEKYIPCYF